MLASQPEVSDVAVHRGPAAAGRILRRTQAGRLDPPLEKLTPFQTEMIALNSSATIRGRSRICCARFVRCLLRAFGQGPFPRQHFLAARQLFHRLRQLNTKIPTLEKLKMPEILKEIPQEKTGLVLVTGATGSGKSTTLAAVLNEINAGQGHPHHHAGRPGGICASAQEGHVQPARTGQ
jgi:twitching motility protein PilT